MKQTAVEWFQEQFNKYYAFSKEEMQTFDWMFNEAKEMEKEQIMNAYNNGDNRSAELYYNETFKSE